MGSAFLNSNPKSERAMKGAMKWIKGSIVGRFSHSVGYKAEGKNQRSREEPKECVGILMDQHR